nr:hypothetical protein [Lachnospiraceae bacterium]
MEKRKIRKKLRSLLSLIMSAVLLAGMIPESVLAGGITTQTVLQAVQEADSGCNVAPPTITSFQTSEEKNASGNWTFSGTFTAVAGAETYELHLGTMEANGSVYERGLYTLSKTATSFSLSPNWYDHTAVAGDTVYAALEAYVKTGSGSSEKWVSTGWQRLSEAIVG